jgi:hypothetical protein
MFTQMTKHGVAFVDSVTREVHTNLNFDRVLQLSNLQMPVESTDAASKQYVDTCMYGNKEIAPVRVATTGPGVRVATTGPGTNGTTMLSAGQYIDGVELVVQDRVLSMHNYVATKNGVYVVKLSGNAERAADMPDGDVALGSNCVVLEGAVNAGKRFVCVTDGRAGCVVGLHPAFFGTRLGV